MCQVVLSFILPDSDPSEALGLVLSDRESLLSGFRLNPEIKVLDAL